MDIEKVCAELRPILQDYFRWRHHAEPESATNEVLARLLTQLQAGEEPISIRSYAFGIARHVLADSRAGERTIPIDLLPEVAFATTKAISTETMLACMEHCIATCLNLRESTFLRRYFAVDSGAAKSEQRKAMAEELDLKPTALRLRVSKLIRKIRPCVKDCCAEAGYKTGDQRR